MGLARDGAVVLFVCRDCALLVSWTLLGTHDAEKHSHAWHPGSVRLLHARRWETGFDKVPSCSAGICKMGTGRSPLCNALFASSMASSRVSAYLQHITH